MPVPSRVAPQADEANPRSHMPDDGRASGQTTMRPAPAKISDMMSFIGLSKGKT